MGARQGIQWRVSSRTKTLLWSRSRQHSEHTGPDRGPPTGHARGHTGDPADFPRIRKKRGPGWAWKFGAARAYPPASAHASRGQRLTIAYSRCSVISAYIRASAVSHSIGEHGAHPARG